MIFRDREQAAELLAEALQTYKVDRPLVLAIPRGAVPMAQKIAEQLNGGLDIVLVHKIGAPDNPEFAIGSVSESGQIYRSQDFEFFDATDAYFNRSAQELAQTLQKQRQAWCPDRPPVNPAGRTVIIVDDGIATGATMLAAVRAVRAQGPKQIIVAAPVASDRAVEMLQRETDHLEVLDVPENFFSISQFYETFPQVEDAEVIRILARDAGLGQLIVPRHASGIVLFAHGSGSSSQSPRNIAVARHLNREGIGTCLFDLLTEEEAEDRSNVFDIPLLANRLLVATRRVRSQHPGLPVGYFGASTGAGAALLAAADQDEDIAAVVSRGGRPDLAGKRLQDVRCPTLLIVGGSDPEVLDLNREALAKLPRGELIVIPGATHLFEEPGTLDQVAVHAARWFRRHLARPPQFQKKAA